MITISLNGAEFFAYHGFYPQEQKLGGRFIVDMEVGFEASGAPGEDEIGNTVDYEQLYAIAETQMKQTRKLIETVAHAIGSDIKERFPFAKKITVSIKKLNPPLRGRVDHSCVTITT